jgi:hypothetical protein
LIPDNKSWGQLFFKGGRMMRPSQILQQILSMLNIHTRWKLYLILNLTIFL